MAHKSPRVIRSLGVVGAGQMGSGIALLAALHEMPVTLCDVSNMALSKGKDAMAASLQRLIKSGKASPDTRDAILARVTTTVSLHVCVSTLGEYECQSQCTHRAGL